MSITKGHRSFPTGIFAVLLCVAATLVFCQNSAAQVNELRQGHLIPQQAAANTPFDGSGTGAIQQGSASRFTNPRNGDVATSNETNSSETNSAMPPIQLSALVSKLAMSTVVVLCLCVAALVVYKKLNLHGSLKLGRPVGGEVPGLCVESTLRLGKNNLLQIVQVDGARMVVASDDNGIKSVTQIGSVFSRELDRIDADETRQLDMADTRNTIRENRSAMASRSTFAKFGNFRVGNDGL